MGAIASQITSLTIVYSTVYSGADQRKHQSSASLAFVRGICRGLVNSLHKWPVTRKMFPFDDIIMKLLGGETAHRYHITSDQCQLDSSPTLLHGINMYSMFSELFLFGLCFRLILWLHQAKCYTGGCLNKKDGLTRYGDSHVKDKTS